VRCHGLCGEDLGGGRQCAELCIAYLEGQPLYLLQQQPRAQDMHVGSSKPGHKMRLKVDGGLTTGVHTGPLAGGPRGTGRVHVCGGSTPGSQWAAESEWGPHDRSVLSPTCSSPGQTTSSHVTTSSGTHMDTIEAASMPESHWLWRGGIELHVGTKQ
jgi:hypothetical protein